MAPVPSPELRLYVEGGGDSQEGKACLRAGFNEFLRQVREACRSAQVRWNLTCAKCDSETIKAFLNSVRQYRQAWTAVLIDADCCHKDGAADAWELMCKRHRDIHDVERSQCHVMVYKMESWFLADPDALEQHFGKGFDRTVLPKLENFEQVSGAAVDDYLRKALRSINRREYHKIQDAGKLLHLLNPDRVRKHSPSCNRLFDTLLTKVNELGTRSR